MMQPLRYLTFNPHVTALYVICPFFYPFRLNERHYGNLQGLNKAQTLEKYGEKKLVLLLLLLLLSLLTLLLLPTLSR